MTVPAPCPTGDSHGQSKEARCSAALAIAPLQVLRFTTTCLKPIGFIRPDNGDKDIFVHATALERAGINGLREGQKVNFDTRNDPRTDKIAVDTIEIA